MPLPGLAVAGVGGLLGGIAGGQQDVTTQRQRIVLAPPTELENQANKEIGSRFSQLGKFADLGPGAQDVTAGLQSQRSLADLLEEFSKGGFLPGESDFATARQFSEQAFQPQQVAINQQFEKEKQRAAQLAAQLGRPVNDPIIQARLSQERQQSQERLGAQQSAFSSQFALGLPQQRLGFAAQLADVRSGLASQAVANRQNLLNLGSQIQSAERQFRLGTAERENTSASGGGLKGAITGAISGIGGGLGVAGQLQNLSFAPKLQSAQLANLGAQTQAFSNFGIQPTVQSFSVPESTRITQPSSAFGQFGRLLQ